MKPCPFCGCFHLSMAQINKSPVEYIVYCKVCLATGPRARTRDGADEVWNGELLDLRNKSRRHYFEKYGLAYPGDLERERQAPAKDIPSAFDEFIKSMDMDPFRLDNGDDEEDKNEPPDQDPVGA